MKSTLIFVIVEAIECIYIQLWCYNPYSSQYSNNENANLFNYNSLSIPEIAIISEISTKISPKINSNYGQKVLINSNNMFNGFISDLLLLIFSNTHTGNRNLFLPNIPYQFPVWKSV